MMLARTSIHFLAVTLQTMPLLLNWNAHLAWLVVNFSTLVQIQMIQRFAISGSSALPLQKMITLLTTKKLNATDFPFNSGLPLNLSLSARSALDFLAFRQCTASDTQDDDPTSPMVLLCFKLETATLVNGFRTGNFGIWNRRYIDYLTSVWNHTFTQLSL